MCILFTLHTNLLHAKMWNIFIELHSLLHGCWVPICGTQKNTGKICSAIFRNWTFLKCPFLKSEAISFSEKHDFLRMQSNAVNTKKIILG